MPIQLTETAAKQFRQIAKEQELPETAKLRVGVKGGGCSGFSYTLDIVEDEKSEDDEEIESNGVKMLVNNRANLYLSEVTIDFKDGVMGRGFVFSNPSASSVCGCGSSFSA